MARTKIERMDTLMCFVLGTLYSTFPFKTHMTLARLPDTFFPDGFDRKLLVGKPHGGDRTPCLEEQMFVSGMRWLYDSGFLGFTPGNDGGFVDCKLTPIGLAILQGVPAFLGGTARLGERMLTEAIRSDSTQMPELVSHALTAAMTLRSHSYYRDHH